VSTLRSGKADNVLGESFFELLADDHFNRNPKGGFVSQSTIGRGSGGNVIAALASLVIPGLGQLAQGRMISALLQLIVAGVLWVLSFGILGWIGNLLSCLDAALWKGPKLD
jgi:TM2 domain-containing membrane protein YozV